MWYNRENRGELLTGDLPNGLCYIISSDKTECCITGYDISKAPNLQKEVVIPSNIEGILVTSIAGGVFESCQLEFISIPSTVKEIGEAVFLHCEKLKDIEVDKDNANYCSIDGNLYSKDGKTLIQYATGKRVHHFVIPNTVETVADRAFAFSKIVSITIPSTVTSLGSFMFYNCLNLIDIKVDKDNVSYKSIDGSLYSKDGRILIQYTIKKQNEIFTIPDGVTEIGTQAFLGCENLIEVSVPNSVTTIRQNAFGRCENLKKIIIPDNVTAIGFGTFAYCHNLEEVSFGNGLKLIDRASFYECYKLKEVIIPEGITEIGWRAFCDCYNLAKIIIPNSAISIGEGAFNNTKLNKTKEDLYYKGLYPDSIRQNFQYEEGKWFREDEIELREYSFPACRNAFNLFDRYYGEIGKDVVFYEVKIEESSSETNKDSKVAVKKIEFIKKINSYKELLN